jgi:ketosteroid isomerase-like protein
MKENQDVSKIEELENARYAAMLSRDTDALDRLLHERLLHVHSTGNQHTKAAYLAGLKNEDWTYQQIDRSQQNIILQGEVALVFNHLFLRLELKGKNIELRNRALSVWIHEQGSWQLLAMHSGIEPPPPPQ